MFEKLNQIAEQAATSASRRQFLGRLGKGALAVAAAAGGLLALDKTAEAAMPRCGRTRGQQRYPRPCRDGRWLCCPARSYCYTNVNGLSYCR